MVEEAVEITDYLPLDAGALSPYITHLWGAFAVVAETEEPIRPFAILPFHLLFMLAVQYKVFRLSAHDPAGYRAALAGCQLYEESSRSILENNPPVPDGKGEIPPSCSARNLSLLREKQLVNFLELLGVPTAIIEKVKELITIRGNYAHANGNIESDIETRINEYMEVMIAIQHSATPINDSLADTWLNEIKEDDDFSEFIEQRMIERCICPADLRSGKLAAFAGSDDLNGTIWSDIVEPLIAADRQRMEPFLKCVSQSHPEEERRSRAAELLDG